MREAEAVANRAKNSAQARKHAIPGILTVLGTVAIIASMFLGWYVVQSSSPTGCNRVAETLYPWWVAVSSSGSSCPASQTGSFSQAGLASTGSLYVAATAFAMGAVVLALLVGGLFLASKRIHRSKAVALIAIFALISGGLAAGILALEQPATVCSDQGFYGTPLDHQSPSAGPSPLNSTTGASPGCNSWSFWSGSGTSTTWSGSSGPWQSFIGTTDSKGAVFSWGPAAGWFLEIGGVILITCGLAVARRSDKPIVHRS
jgi:hypothetical protein